MAENTVSIEKISKKYGEKTIIESVSFGLKENEKIGLVAINGCGKTTLLKMIAGEEYPDTGKITFRKNLKTGYLPQKPKLNPENTVWEEIFESKDEKFLLLKEYGRILFQSEHEQSAELFDKQQTIYDKIEHSGAWEIETKARKYLSLLGLKDPNKIIGNLSGGEQRRVDIARVLMSDPDVILLDEPTNHLDIDSIEWLQDFLRDSKSTLLFVTHDRYFLDEVCTGIMAIDEGKVKFYNGNYSYYLEKKAMELIDLQRKETRRQSQLKRELKWLNRGARARSSKPKNHLDRVHDLMNKSYLKPENKMKISFQTVRQGKTVLEVHNITKKYDKNLFSNFSHFFTKGEKVGIIGDNGSGKTTFLKILTGTEKPDSGFVKTGLNTRFSYFRQEDEIYAADISVTDYINEYAPNVKTGTGSLLSASEILKRFLFNGKMQHSKLSSLSGGERRRLFLLKSLLFGANFLIMDEPTNDFDIKTLEILEDYLDDFPGCLLIVSHDRYFLDRTVDSLFVFEEGKIIKFPGNYSDFLLVKKYKKEKKEEKINKKELYKEQKSIKIKKISYKDKLELEATEKEIAELEEKLAEQEKELSENSANLGKDDFIRISRESEEIEKKLNIKMERWEELEALNN